MSEITARVRLPIDRISQCDIFHDITVVENIKIEGAEVEMKTITFPYVIRTVSALKMWMITGI